MKVPGPEHPITISADPRRLQVRYAGHVIADSARALTLAEAGYAPVTYFPREDVAMAYLSRTDRVTHCPYKGEARYYTVLMDGRFAENAVWTYEEPYPAMDAIRGRLAFYPNQVEIYAVGVAEHPDAVREAVEHTDDGAGASQKPPWPPNAELPRDF
ncbi:MAG: DUF427 domain-containing protein [Caulobacteraceae bacterium]|nr:DUF427 domain-containing protein [Caulobacteraceae bacterium]